MHVRQAAVEQPAQVGAQQVPGEEVRLAAVLAVDDQPTHAAWLEQRLEDLEVFEVGEDVLTLVRAQRDGVFVVEVVRRVGGISGERVQR